jgi:hypothetical protein
MTFSPNGMNALEVSKASSATPDRKEGGGGIRFLFDPALPSRGPWPDDGADGRTRIPGPRCRPAFGPAPAVVAAAGAGLGAGPRATGGRHRERRAPPSVPFNAPNESMTLGNMRATDDYCRGPSRRLARCQDVCPGRKRDRPWTPTAGLMIISRLLRARPAGPSGSVLLSSTGVRLEPGEGVAPSSATYAVAALSLSYPGIVCQEQTIRNHI